MIALPASLSPWSRELGAFPPEVGLAVGPLVQRIAAAIDPMHREDVPGDDDPDGFDGLVNRGSYERLIASDWLLADEIPEEFERRATMREHLFLKTAKRDRAHGLGSVVLFDAGPDQLGSPRLAHLATLLVLLRRALRARANFSWGILQNPDEPLLPGSSEAEILSLLRARTSLKVSESALNGWIRRCLETTAPEEVWLVGGKRLHEISPQHVVSRVKVEDVLEPGARKVSVEILRAKGRPRRVLLELPDDGACARLLRNPYQIGVTAPQALPAPKRSSGLIFAQASLRLFATCQDGSVMSLPLPSTPWETPVSPRRHTLGNIGRIVAINRLGRSTLVVSLEEVSLRLSYIGNENQPPPGHYFLRLNPFAWPKENAEGLLFPCLRPPLAKGGRACLLVLDATGNLFRLESDGGEPAAVLEESGVLAVSTRIPAYLCLDKTSGDVAFVPVSRRSRTVVARECAAGDKAFFGFSPYMEPTSLLAIEKSPRNWLMVAGLRRPYEIPIREEQEVVGVVQEKDYAEALVTVPEDRRVITLKGRDWERVILESPDPITQVAVSQSKPLLAYVTTSEAITVHSLTHRRTLCRYRTEDRYD